MATSRPLEKKEWSPPLVFDEYQILWLLGRGGMGEVYLGHDRLLDRPIAIKFMNSIGLDGNTREAYLNEARAAARLQHPNVVTVHRVGEIDGRVYIVSEYVRGQTLEAMPKPLPWRQVLEIAIGLARGLAEAHRRGVLHRDIKPANALLTDNSEIKLLDFGLAKRFESPESLSLPISRTEIVVEGTAPTIDFSDPKLPVPVEERSAASTQDAPALPVVSALPLPPPPRATKRIQGVVDPGMSGQVRLVPPVSGIKGTPAYMAPGVLAGQAATRRSDVYSMGALLFEMCAGVVPHYDVPINQLQAIVPTRDAPLLIHMAPGADPRFTATIDRCLRRNAAERFRSGEELLEALQQLLPSAQEKAPPGNPYRALWPFTMEQRSLYFGRRGETATLAERLHSEPALLIVGGSGIGKTSLCQAGVLPLFQDGQHGMHAPERTWRVAMLSPGKRPMQALVDALSTVLPHGEEALRGLLNEGGETLGRKLVEHQSGQTGLVLFVDQLEELLTAEHSEEARRASRVLGSLSHPTPGFKLLMAARSDLQGALAALPGLDQVMNRFAYHLRPLTAERLREVISSPIRLKGGAFDNDNLINDLVASAAPCDGSLPLLELTLAELWEARDGNNVTAATLASIGGIAGAISRHADHVIGSMLTEHRPTARRILCALASPSARGLLESELLALDAQAGKVLEALVRMRLLFVRSTADGIRYSIAHTTLVEDWPTMKRWQAEPVEVFSPSRPPGGRRQPQWRVRVGLGAATVAIVGLSYGALNLRESRQIRHRIDEYLAQGQRERDMAQKCHAEMTKLLEQALAAQEQQPSDKQQQLLASAHAMAVSTDRSYARASHQLEAAIHVDGTREDIRELLADVLYERALAAETHHEEGLLDDLLSRLALYDRRGERQKRWQQPGRLSLNSIPSGATVQIIRYAQQQSTPLSPLTTWTVGTTPLQHVELEPGAYIVVVTTPGHVTVRRPLLLGRAAEQSLSIDLPKSVSSP